MKRFLKFLFFAPLAILLILISVANRSQVTLSLDPLNANNPAISYDLPLFVVVFLAFLIGLVVGGLMIWASQGRHCRALREKDFEVNIMKRQQKNQIVESPVQEIAPGLPVVSRS